MSCDGNRHAYFTAVAGAGSAAAQAFGSTADAVQALDDLFELARNGPRPPAEVPLAEAHTRLLFGQMQRRQIKPPTHSKRGLPKADAQFGYALVQRTLAALERGEPLPYQARDLLVASARTREIRGARADASGRVRCGGCGQFTSPTRGHVCARTATPAALRRSLVRRLGVPPTAYPDADLTALLDAARASAVTMRHPATGETVQVTLDGLPLALGNGFVPEVWAETGRRVVTPTGSVLTVINGTGLAEPGAAPPQAAQLDAKRAAIRQRLRQSTDADEQARLRGYLRDLDDAARDLLVVAGAAAEHGLQITADMPIIGSAALPTPSEASPIDDLNDLRAELMTVSLYLSGRFDLGAQVQADAEHLMTDYPAITRARAESIAAARMLAAYEEDMARLQILRHLTDQIPSRAVQSPLDAIHAAIDAAMIANGGIDRMLQEITGSATVAVDLDGLANGAIDTELATLSERPRDWDAILADDAADSGMCLVASGVYATYASMPPNLRRRIMHRAQWGDADSTVPATVQPAAAAVAAIDPTSTPHQDAADRIRALAQALVAAGGATHCPRCGQWTSPTRIHTCPRAGMGRGDLPNGTPQEVQAFFARVRVPGTSDTQALGQAYALWYRTDPIGAALGMATLNDSARLAFGLHLDPRRQRIMRMMIAGTFADGSSAQTRLLGDTYTPITTPSAPEPEPADDDLTQPLTLARKVRSIMTPEMFTAARAEEPEAAMYAHEWTLDASLSRAVALLKLDADPPDPDVPATLVAAAAQFQRIRDDEADPTETRRPSADGWVRVLLASELERAAGTPHCPACGRFVPPVGGHACPIAAVTADAAVQAAAGGGALDRAALVALLRENPGMLTHWGDPVLRSLGGNRGLRQSDDAALRAFAAALLLTGAHPRTGDLATDLAATLADQRANLVALAADARAVGEGLDDGATAQERAALLRAALLLRDAPDLTATEQRAITHAHDGLGTDILGRSVGRLADGGAQLARVLLRRLDAPGTNDRDPEPAPPTSSPPGTGTPDPAPRSAAESFAYGSDPTRAYTMRYRVVDLDDLVPSNLDSGAINPAYDSALQPRQRDRAASQAQIAKVAQTLTPDALLTDFKQLDKGTPILGPDDRCVESGNGRVLALRKARDTFPAQWQAYQDRLRAVADSFGIAAEELAGMRAPVLVRERQDVVDRAAFAREANAPPVLQMSTLENARVDAGRLTDDTLLRLAVRDDQSIDLALRARSNAGFVRDFMQTLPENERATLMRADGTLNQQGIWRIKAALFTRVFPGEGGARVAETFTEALDSTTKNFEQAVAGTLPALVRAQSRISSGQRSADLDLSGDMAASLDMLARLREQDLPVAVYLNQSSLFERELTPTQETMLAHFDRIGRSPKAIRGFLNAYAQAITDAPDPNQTAMFGGGGMTKDQLLARLLGSDSSGTPAAVAA